MLLAAPEDRREFRLALELYSPQKRVARWLKQGLGFAARSGMPLPLKKTQMSIGLDSPFAQFLTGVAQEWSEPNRGLAVLAGNPNAAGRRFILLLLSEGGPKAVIKAGAAGAARDLILREAEFLQSTQWPGMVPPLAVFHSEEMAAFATVYLSGESPLRADRLEICGFLSRWIDRTSNDASLESFASWQQLALHLRKEEKLNKWGDRLGSRKVKPVLMHGDFAPWNIRVNPQTRGWQVMDWERGSLRGIPSWDWLHFEIQRSILVRHSPPGNILRDLENLVGSPEFQKYAIDAGITGIEKSLVIAYLLYMKMVHPPSEGRLQLEALLQLAMDQWNDV